MKCIFGIDGLSITEYAISANAILGIRDSGKTYTATEASEELYDATPNIPFVWLDPIGVAHNLRIPGKGRGYPVVVAGGRHGDLPLTVQNAGEILRAAMRSGVSLVIDLFSVQLSKADWRRIVRQCCEILLYENTEFGLRHLFIEEAAEFVPQKPMDYDVFSAVEKLVRMGGNSKVGVTLINQRSADLNKSVLELCANVFVHRQKGKNTLLDLKKWFTLLDLSDAEQRKIADSLPNLKSGECWALLNDLEKPVFLKIPEKNSLHPDRRAVVTVAEAAKRKPVPADKFVSEMTATLPKLEEERKANDPKALHARIAVLEKQLKAGTSAPVEKINTGEIEAAAEARGFERGEAECAPIWLRRGAESALAAAKDAVGALNLASFIDEQLAQWKAIGAIPQVPKHASVAQVAERRVSNPKAAGASPAGRSNVRDRVLGALAELEAIGVSPAPRIQVAFLANYKHDGVPNFRNTAGALRSEGLIAYPDSSTMQLTDAGRAAAPKVNAPMTSEDFHDRIISLLGGVEGRIVPHLIKAYPDAMDRNELAQLASYAHAGVPNFRNSLGRLRSLGFIDYPNSQTAIARSTLFLEGR